MSEFYPGDPASHVVGRAAEKPARRHSRQKPKPKAATLTFEDRLVRDIRSRMAQLEPLVKEIPRLEAALKKLKEIK